ncbi:hypothetical protein D3C75_863200 [compost metagenome]
MSARSGAATILMPSIVSKAWIPDRLTASPRKSMGDIPFTPPLSDKTVSLKAGVFSMFSRIVRSTSGFTLTKAETSFTFSSKLMSSILSKISTILPASSSPLYSSLKSLSSKYCTTILKPNCCLLEDWLTLTEIRFPHCPSERATTLNRSRLSVSLIVREAG